MAEQLVNVHDLVGRCPFATSQKLLAGKWSLLIMHELAEGPVRFRELERRLYPITQATLTRALRQLEDDGLVLSQNDHGDGAGHPRHPHQACRPHPQHAYSGLVTPG